jgi:hypothetical protein
VAPIRQASQGGSSMMRWQIENNNTRKSVNGLDAAHRIKPSDGHPNRLPLRHLKHKKGFSGKPLQRLRMTHSALVSRQSGALWTATPCQNDPGSADLIRIMLAKKLLLGRNAGTPESDFP